MRDADTGLPIEATVTAGAFSTTSDPGSGVFDLAVPDGTYTVTASCPNGGISTATVIVDTRTPAPAPQLILALEGLQSAGQVGEIDSAAALAAAIVANGQTVAILYRSPLDYACIDDLTAAAESVWVLAGTYPDAYSAVSCVAILEAAAEVAAANHELLAQGRGTPVTAIFDGNDYQLTGNVT